MIRKARGRPASRRIAHTASDACSALLLLVVVRWFMAKRKPDGSAGATREQTILSQPSDPVRARSELVQQVQSGAMAPKDAESQAERLGIAPLIAQPDPANFDPMSEVAWTLPMVAAWMRFRSADKVCEWWIHTAVKFAVGESLRAAAGSLQHQNRQHCST